MRPNSAHYFVPEAFRELDDIVGTVEKPACRFYDKSADQLDLVFRAWPSIVD